MRRFAGAHDAECVRRSESGDVGYRSTTFTYEPNFFQLATITDPLNHTWTIDYDASGRPASLTDPLSHETTLGTNSAGQVTSLTDPLSHTWQFGYIGGDLTSVTDPLSAVRGQLDAAGRVTQGSASVAITYD